MGPFRWLPDMCASFFQIKTAENFYRAIVNAMPVSVFIFNADVEILEMNETARRTFGINNEDWKSRRAGDALHCLNAISSENGCGSAEKCSDCAIRNMVRSCASGDTQAQRRMFFERVEDGHLHELELLITCVPMPYTDQKLTLLVAEDLTPLTRLKELLPICVMCKSIRNDEQYWQSLESYFHENGVDFSHGICPTCRERHYGEFLKKSGRA